MDFLFVIKKVIGSLLNPISLTLLLILIGLILSGLSRRIARRFARGSGQGVLVIRTRKRLQRVGLALALAGCLLLYLASLGPVAGALVRTLERQSVKWIDERGQPKIEEAPAYLVVLAGGHRFSEKVAPLSRLSSSAFARMVNAVDLHRDFPDSIMIVTGTPKETRAMKEVAVELGIPEDAIIEETRSGDTDDHPRFIREFVGDSPFLLITSATHMPRAAALFEESGLSATPVPVDFQAWPPPKNFRLPGIRQLAPKATNLFRTEVCFHETVGMWWARLRGQVP